MSGIGVAVSPNLSLGGAAFSPADIANLELDLNASLGVTEGTGGVSDWASQAGGWVCTQATESQRPTLNAASANMNGQPSISFGAGTTKALPIDITSSSSDWTWFAAVYQGPTTPLAALYDAGSGTQLRLRATSGTMYSAHSGVSIGVAMGTSAAHIICARHAASVGMMQIDGTISAGTLPAHGIAAPGCIGGRFNGTGNDTWEGEIGRIIAYKAALSDTDKDLVVAYLAGIYGVTI